MIRRAFLSKSVAMATIPQIALHESLPNATNEERYQNGASPWPICLDTATIRPAKGIEEKVKIAAEAGYDAIEPWDWELAEFEKQGGDLKALGKKIKEMGLFVPSMIGLWGCLPATEEDFQKSLPATRNRLRMASAIGCTFAQAIPNEIGANYNNAFAAGCYRRLLEIGITEYNVIPSLVFVNLFPLKTMGQATAVVMDANHPQGKIIPDVFHMYITGGGFEGLKHVNGNLFAIFQFNDAPKDMKIQDMKDEHRVYPGDGILPLPQILKDLKQTGFKGCISLELYNKTYHTQDLLTVAKTGLKKTLEMIKKAEV